MHVKPKNFYPANGVTDSAEVNANYNAFEGSLGTGQIDQENIRTEGIDYRNLHERPIHKYVAQTSNGYLLSIGDVAAADARYESYATLTASPSGPNESPINHDETGTSNTTIGKGTKMRINGTAGAHLQGGETIHVNWDLNAWSDYYTASLADMVSQLIDNNTKDGATGATYPYGSGIGEWCWLVYPKFNTTSNALNDNDFQDAKSAGLVIGNPDYLDPSTCTSTITKGNFRAFRDRRWDHVMVIPSVFFSASDDNTKGIMMINQKGTTVGGTEQDALGGPQMFNGSFTFKVQNNIGSTKLYGIQLYISGFWRMHSSGTVAGDPIAGMYLEATPCDPDRTNTDGDPIPEYGIHGELGIERVRMNAVVYTHGGA